MTTRIGVAVVSQKGAGMIREGGWLSGKMKPVPYYQNVSRWTQTLCSIIARNTIPSRARLLLTALEPRAIPSARACMHKPIVVFERPLGVSTNAPEGTRSSRGDDGRDDNGIGDRGLRANSNGGRNVNRCITRYPSTKAIAIATCNDLSSCCG